MPDTLDDMAIGVIKVEEVGGSNLEAQNGSTTSSKETQQVEKEKKSSSDNSRMLQGQETRNKEETRKPRWKSLLTRNWRRQKN